MNYKSKIFIHDKDALKDVFLVDDTLPDPAEYPTNTFRKPKKFGQPLSPLDLYPEKSEQKLYQEVYTKEKFFAPGVGYIYFWYRAVEKVDDPSY